MSLEYGRPSIGNYQELIAEQKHGDNSNGYNLEPFIEANQAWMNNKELTPQDLESWTAKGVSPEDLRRADNAAHHDTLKPKVALNTDDPNHWSHWE